MRIVLFLGLMAVGLAACGTSKGTDPTGWSRYDGTPVKGNAALEQQFRYDDDRCYGRDMKTYKYCMFSRGFTDEVVPVAATPAIAAATPAIAAAAGPTEWRARAAEARAVATRLQDPVAKQMIFGVADTYDRLADYAEGRPTNSPKSRTTRRAADAQR